MPDILIDISRLFYFKLTGRRFTGIDRVGLEYLRHYADRARAVLTLGPFSSVLSAPDSARVFRSLLDDGARMPAARLVTKAFLRWWTRPAVDGCALLNTSHTGLERTDYAAELRRRGARCVYLVHDLIPITHPQHCRPGERERHVTRMRTALATGRGLIVPSRHTLETLTRFAGEAGLPLPPAVAAPLASGLPRAEAGPRPLAEPYFVVLGSIEPRKNHALLLQLWRSLVASHESRVASRESQVTNHKTQDAPQDTPHSSLLTPHSGKSEALPRLVIIGRRGWNGDGIMEPLARDEALQGCVTELDSCGDRELVTYLRHAQALLFPSFTEGYGLPLAEALALGTPAIASNLPVFREVAGDIPEYADPLDVRRWLELVADYAEPGSARRAAQLERMRGLQLAGWAQHFEKIDGFLLKLNK